MSAARIRDPAPWSTPGYVASHRASYRLPPRVVADMEPRRRQVQHPHVVVADLAQRLREGGVPPDGGDQRDVDAQGARGHRRVQGGAARLHPNTVHRLDRIRRHVPHHDEATG
jgi:hypothetical protein